MFHCGINNKAFGNVVYQTGNRRMIGTCNKVMTGKNGLLPRQVSRVLRLIDDDKRLNAI